MTLVFDTAGIKQSHAHNPNTNLSTLLPTLFT